jgi:hypothetical protein
MDQMLPSDSIYFKAQPLQWLPDFFGGGPSQSVAGDMLVEQTISTVTSSQHTFKVHYKVTHLGSDIHGTGGQEFLAASGVSSKAANWGHFKTGQRKWRGTVRSCTRS